MEVFAVYSANNIKSVPTRTLCGPNVDIPDLKNKCRMCLAL